MQIYSSAKFEDNIVTLPFKSVDIRGIKFSLHSMFGDLHPIIVKLILSRQFPFSFKDQNTRLLCCEVIGL